MIATGPGLACPGCGGPTTVTDSRGGEGYIRRRRKCLDPACATPRFSTLESMVGESVANPEWMRLGRRIGGMSPARRQVVMFLIRELGGAPDDERRSDISGAEGGVHGPSTAGAGGNNG